MSLDGSNGFVLNGINSDDISGVSVAGAGDVNGDGIDDIIIGADGASPGGRSGAGQSYVVFGSDQGFPAVIELSALEGSNGFALNGIASGDNSGSSVSGAGDVNGDGIHDVIIGAPARRVPPFLAASQSYVVFGTDQGFPAALELSALDGNNGFVLNSIGLGDGAGASVSGAGDVNGDGIDDVIIGADRASPGGRVAAGQSYVVFGTDQGFPAEIDLATLDGGTGFALNGIGPGDFCGGSVSGAGDANGDGFDDIIIGAFGAEPGGRTNAGQSYVVFGTDQGFPAVVELATLDGTNGLILNGINAMDNFGFSVSGAGDLNRDGIDDIMIGATGGNHPGPSLGGTGQSFVVLGTDQGFPATIELSALDGSNGFIVNGINSGDDFGGRVSDAGDVNGDGVDDVIIGAFLADPAGRSMAGQSYVGFGRAGGFPPVMAVSALDGSNGFALNGIASGDRSGSSVSAAGDVNGDGIDDIIIGALGADPGGRTGAGQSYVVFGRPMVDLLVTGTCPGAIALDIAGASPNGSVAVGSAPGRGTFTVPAGACAGTAVDLASPRPEATLAADAGGLISLTVPLTLEHCGRFVQSLDLATCLVSNLARVP